MLSVVPLSFWNKFSEIKWILACLVHSSKKWYTPLVHWLVWNELSLGWIFRYSKHSYGLDQLGPNEWRLEVFKNVKYILLASRVLELQFVKKLDFSFILHNFIWKQRHLWTLLIFFSFCELHQLWQSVFNSEAP